MKTIGLVGNITKKAFWDYFPEMLNWFASRKIPLILSETIAESAENPVRGAHNPILPDSEMPGECDLILAVGGDGTMLRTVNLVGSRETPILGINVGGLGFLTDIPLESFPKEFSRIMEGEFRVEKRLMLKAVIAGENESFCALNEIVIDKGNSIRVIEIEVHVDGHYLNSYIADGLLMSTPTGSTGYSLSSGGPIVSPQTNAIVINPICPHSLTNRPVIIPSNAHIKTITRTEADTFTLSQDGQNVIACKTRTEIHVEKAPFCANLVKPVNSNYYHLLQTKLNWGRDFRDKNRWSHNS